MNEEEIGKKAAAMLQNSLRRESNSFSSHLRSGKDSLQNAQAQPRFRTSKRSDGSEKKYLKGIAVVMGRHGFVLHYGIASGTTRKAHSRTRHKPQEKTYRVKAHPYRKGLKKHSFLRKSVDNSQVMTFLAKEITEVRGEEIVTWLAGALSN